MLSSIRNFSKSIFAKILLGIVVIPLIFWGMGSSFSGGSKNVVVVIDKEKYTTQDFANYIQTLGQYTKKITSDDIESLIRGFIASKLIINEHKKFGIKLTDESLADLIKNQKEFKRDNSFSRTQYEKFLLTNNIDAVNFEKFFKNEEKKKQLLDFIGGGIVPSKFLVNSIYNEINQKRGVDIINLNDAFANDLIFSQEQIKTYFEKNNDEFSENYKTIKILELSPKRLVGDDDYNDLFFKKIDEIDDEIIRGNNFDEILKKHNLESKKSISINKNGYKKDGKKAAKLSVDLIKNIFEISESEPTMLIEDRDKFYIVEIFKTETIKMNLDNEAVLLKIKKKLETESKRKMVINIIDKLNKGNFTKKDFDNFSNEKNVNIKKITLVNRGDESKLKREIVSKIYSYPEKKIIVVNDIEFVENYLIYINQVENVSISEDSKEYANYLNLSQMRIKNEIYNTYDEYIKNKYKIDINYNALKTVKNYFN